MAKMEALEAKENDTLSSKNVKNKTMKSTESLKKEGNLAFKKGQYEKAADCYSQAIEQDAKVASIYCNRSACMYRLKKFQQSLEDSEKALQIDAQYAKVLTNLNHFLNVEIMICYATGSLSKSNGASISPET